MHEFPNAFVSRELQFAGALGGAKRNEPVGAVAYGIPRNLFTATEPAGPAMFVVVPMI